MKAGKHTTVEVKRDILWRVYLSYIAVGIVCLVIFGKAVYIQQVQGKQYRSMSDSLHQKIESIDADRGTIYSANMEMLSTSLPQFDIYIDFAADALRNNSGKLFRENLDSLSIGLSQLFKDKPAAEYKKILTTNYRKKNRYFLLKRKIDFRKYQQLRQLPLVKLGRNKSGFIAQVKHIRLNPYQMMAFRTIGLDRDSFKVGLELTYDSVLRGTKGRRLVRYIAGGVSVPVENNDLQIEPQDGKDVVTTLDIHIQEITQNALLKMLKSNDADHGCAIVMEVKTGKIKAIANLGRVKDSAYWENFNYALSPTEPGSTFKLATLLAVLEDKKVSLNTQVNLEGGVWKVAGRTVYDSEKHGLQQVTVKQSFEASSNVAMAKLAHTYYNQKPSQFITHLRRLGMDKTTGLDLRGERTPVIYRPGGKYWSNTTLPWMAFGYNIAITPVHTAMLYNAIANNGIMMKPYLVESIQQDGLIYEQKKPVAIGSRICSQQTVRQLQDCLEGVCTVEGGTGYSLFKNSPYKVAGKTGTALVANGSRGYADHIYQSSFAGYFPSDNPQYTIVVIIKNKPHAARYYGASVAGPVFKEIADRLYTMHVREGNTPGSQPAQVADSSWFRYVGNPKDVEEVFAKLQLNYNDNSKGTEPLVAAAKTGRLVALKGIQVNPDGMPSLIGLGLKDAVTLCESMGLAVNATGKGKVRTQSVREGSRIIKGQLIDIQLN